MTDDIDYLMLKFKKIKMNELDLFNYILSGPCC